MIIKQRLTFRKDVSNPTLEQLAKKIRVDPVVELLLNSLESLKDGDCALDGRESALGSCWCGESALDGRQSALGSCWRDNGALDQ